MFLFDKMGFSNNLENVNKVHVLVTGGAGYIGSVLVPMLLEKGYKVTVYDLFKYGSESLSSCIYHNENLRLVKGDILNESHLKQVMHDADVIVHLAAIVGYPACDKDPELAYKVNVIGTRNITSNIRTNQHLIFSSTGSCYGAIKNGLCTEETPLNPLTLYGRSKAEGEKLCLNVQGVCLRLATIFGVSPRMRLDLLINNFTYRCLFKNRLEVYEAHFKRTFLHVRDAARAFIFAIENYESMKEEVFNIGCESYNYTKGEICQLIQASVSSDCEIVISNDGFDADQRDYEVCFKKISKLGYSPIISIKDGITELCKILPYMSIESLDKMNNLI